MSPCRNWKSGRDEIVHRNSVITLLSADLKCFHIDKALRAQMKTLSKYTELIHEQFKVLSAYTNISKQIEFSASQSEFCPHTQN